MPIAKKVTGKKTTEEIIDLYGVKARKRLKPFFNQAGISYPPKKVTFLAIKDKSTFEIWAANDNTQYSFIRNYDIKKLSGINGPKLREGDKQVPEGLYKIVALNPNSAYHLSMKLNYPNQFDQKHASEEGRDEPGTNIFIHGKSVSVGCLAMGDSAIEELFVLTKETGLSNINVIISPSDPRIEKLKYDAKHYSSWVGELYKNIEKEILPYNNDN
ncbi:MAG: L,D-transpeptidase family protein [Gammaproteobacteria bacterium]|nr:L,D-transpeptidase family protein [Gammaproteobacteria bacterium]